MNSPAFWYKLTVNIPEERQEIVGAFLFREGSVGLENRPDSLCAYFTPDFRIEEIANRTGKFLQSLGFHVKVHIKKIPAENWNENWKRNFKPLKIGNRFLVKPSWENLGRQTNRIVITIDPGRAFGTGIHETTQLVLTLMEPILQPKVSLWDVGTGTGILAIAAAKMGLKNILANDIDPVAVETAVENAQLNQVDSAIQFFVGSANAVKKKQFDAILMNILSGIIYKLLPDVLPHLKPNGWLFLSGILEKERADFLKELGRYPLKIQKIKRKGEWIGLIVRKEKE